MSSRLVVTGGRFHRYTLDIGNGESVRVPSVTGVAGVLAKDALAPAAAKEVALHSAIHAGELVSGALSEAAWVARAKASYREVWNRSRDDGTRVHSIAERLVFGEPVATVDPVTGEDYSDDVVRMGEQCARFMDAWRVDSDSSLVEHAVFNDELLYAGRFDLLAGMPGNERWLIDIKTGASGVWGETALQLTGYSRATHVQVELPDGSLRDLLMPPVARCAALWVRPDAWELLPVKSDEFQWSTFRHLREVVPWAALDRDELIGAPLPVPAPAA